MSNIKLVDDVYKSLLKAVGLEVTSDYFVKMRIDKDTTIQAVKGGKPLVLPVPDQLRSPEIANRLVFHPLGENSLTKDTEILTFYRHLLIHRINVVTNVLGTELLRIASSEAIARRMTPEQQEYLRLVPNVDEVALKNFEAIGNEAIKPHQVQKVYMSIYLKKGALINKTSYQRVASINFPFYDALVVWELDDKDRKANKGKKTTKGDYEIFDVPLRVKDRDTFKGIMEYLIPNVQDSHFYDIGSNSQIAPGMDAMMRSVTPLIAHLNNVCELFTGVIPQVEEMIFDSDWVEAFNNLQSLWTQIRAIPQQSALTEEEPAAKPAAVVQPGRQPAPVPQPQSAMPWRPPQPTYTHPQGGYPPPVTAQRPPQSSSGGMSVRSVLQAQSRQQPMMHPGSGYPGYPQQGGYPPMPMGQPYPPYQQTMPMYNNGPRRY